MDKHFNKAIDRTGFYLTYSEITGIQASKSNIIDTIRSLNQHDVIRVLSMLNALSLKDTRKLIKYEPKQGKSKNSFSLFDNISILYTLKWVLAFGDSRVNKTEDNADFISKVLILIVKISDYIFEDLYDGTPETTYTKLVLADRDNSVDRSLIRYQLFFEEICRDKELFKGQRFYDIHDNFEKHYGYKMKDFVAVIFAVTEKITSNVKYEDLNFFKEYGLSVDGYFKDYGNATVSRKIISDLSTNPDKLREEAFKTLDNAFDNEYLLLNPLIEFEGKIFVVSKPLLNSVIFNGLFFKILNSFKEKSNFFGFFGYVFELYSSKILRESVINSKTRYNYIDEFKYGKGRKSSDFYVYLGKSLLIFEFKGGRLTKDTKVKGSINSTNKEFNKFVSEPILQADKCYKDLVINGKFGEFTKVYIISGTYNAFPKNRQNMGEFRSDNFKNKLNSNVVFYDQVGMLDIEILATYLESQKKRSVFRFLLNKLQYDDFSSYTFYYCDKFKTYKRTEYQNKVLNRCLDSLMEVFK